jgi:5'-3' exonuclease
MKNIVLIDTSYTSFYRFFATMRWYNFAYKEEYKNLKEDNTYDWTTNEDFFEKYKKMYFESILKLIGKQKSKNSIFIFALDSSQKSLWRNELTDNYKGGREDLSKKVNIKTIFKHTYTNLIPNLVKNNDNIFKIKVDELEADDVIALTVKYMKNKNLNNHIDLISGDKDFLQLGNDNITFLDYRKKKDDINLSQEEANEILFMKIVKGDCSDNIKSIFTDVKLTSKKKKELLLDKNLLIEYINENPNIKKSFETNKKLIDFDYIPKKYNQKVFEKVKNIIN